MRNSILSLMFLAFHEGYAESKTILLTPESVDEDCARSWEATETEGHTLIRFKDLNLDWTATANAQIKHCRLAWKPLIPPGCYAPSGRLEVRGHYKKESGATETLKAQLRLSHDLLGQGDSSKVESVDLEDGPFQVNIELPPERFQKRWEEVKLITHLSLYLRKIKQESGTAVPRDARVKSRLVIDALELEAVRSQECPGPDARG